MVGIYLAAGSSTRMGAEKLALPVGEMPLGSIALREALASRLAHVFVVTRADDKLEWATPALARAAFLKKWTHVPCADAGQGQAHSMQCGVRAAQRARASAAMILLADQPLVSTEVIDELMAHFQNSTQQEHQMSYVAASYQGLLRPPVVFAADLFPALLQLRGDEGARRLLRDPQTQSLGCCIEFTDPDLFFDVDTPEDYARLALRKKSP